MVAKKSGNCQFYVLKNQRKSLPWRWFGYLGLTSIKFFELLLWISSRIINALRRCNKLEKRAFHQVSQHLVVSTHFSVFGYSYETLFFVRWTFIRLSHDGIALSCWSWRFDCNTARLHQAMTEVNCLRVAICSMMVRCYWCISIFIIIPTIRCCSLTGPLCGWSAVVLSDRRYPSFWNFDSTISIDVIRIKSYMDSLWPYACTSEGHDQ